ncbi:MAG: cupin-like domain-containing protein [Bacteroidetes bacterium]|nr:MAG: cupin-like domain-containing protein [Bacteroidota bacterium]
MKLTPVEKRHDLTREEFRERYLRPRRPVILTNFATEWPATTKWTWDWLIQKYGHLEVALVDNEFHKPGKNYMVPRRKMKFGDYLQLIRTEPTELRLFLFNIFQHAPELTKDFSFPNFMDNWAKKYPFMFFGGQGSAVNLHYDIDCSSVFLTQFANKKRVVLFGPEQSRFLYQHPFTVQSHVDVNHPDYEKYPAFRKAQGYEAIIGPGETLYIPSTYWHYIDYIEGGYSMSLRANDKLQTQIKGLWNITRHFVVDKGMNLLLGPKWKELKETIADRRAAEALQEA